MHKLLIEGSTIILLLVFASLNACTNHSDIHSNIDYHIAQKNEDISRVHQEGNRLIVQNIEFTTDSTFVYDSLSKEGSDEAFFHYLGKYTFDAVLQQYTFKVYAKGTEFYTVNKESNCQYLKSSYYSEDTGYTRGVVTINHLFEWTDSTTNVYDYFEPIPFCGSDFMRE